jgi:CDGSH-type Zn-finger protein
MLKKTELFVKENDFLTTELEAQKKKLVAAEKENAELEIAIERCQSQLNKKFCRGNHLEHTLAEEKNRHRAELEQLKRTEKGKLK